MNKIKRPAIKTTSGKVVEARSGQHHPDIPAKGQRGFTTTDGAFVNRTEAGKIAVKSGQANGMTSTRLHSSNLKKGK